MKKMLLLFTTLLVPKLCDARIGETMDECTARYGPMLEVKNATGKFYSEYPQYRFSFQHLIVLVRFFNGRSAQEEFYGSDLLDDYAKAQAITEANSKKETGFDVIVAHEGRRLTITTKEFDQLMKKELGEGNF
jgi:hypothetical protein